MNAPSLVSGHFHVVVLGPRPESEDGPLGPSSIIKDRYSLTMSVEYGRGVRKRRVQKVYYRLDALSGRRRSEQDHSIHS